MTRRASLSTFAAMLCMLVFGAMSSVAETPTNIAGSWTFTATVPDNCTFGGTARITLEGQHTYSCELTARQICLDLEKDYLVRQSCEVSLLGNQVSVRSTIVEFVNGFSSLGYFPDNFTLTVQSNSRLYGALISGGSRWPAEWRRSEEGIS